MIGNIAVQLIAAGAIPDIRAAREIIGRSFEVKGNAVVQAPHDLSHCFRNRLPCFPAEFLHPDRDIPRLK